LIVRANGEVAIGADVVVEEAAVSAVASRRPFP
jgi:hypothetical protein